MEVKKANARHTESRGNGNGIQNLHTESRDNGNGIKNLTRTKNIFIGGFLAPTITQNDIRNYFEKFGTVTEAGVIYDPQTRRPRGFGFVKFDSEDVVDIVVEKDIHEFNGNTVEVKRTFPEGRSRASNGHFSNSAPILSGAMSPSE